jgi:uncharacterized membrane protein YeiB
MSAIPPPGLVLRAVSSSERVQYLDVLRGFALYGVLVANIIWMACDMVLTPAAARQLPTHSVDRVVKYLVVFFIDGKFITLFSFLFAVGFTIQMQRAVQRGGNAVSTYARRVAVLMLIGVAHIVFIWFGDILLIYGFLGFALLAMRNWRPGKPMLVAACLLILLTRPAFLTVQNVIAQGRSTHARPCPSNAAISPVGSLAAFYAGSIAILLQSARWSPVFTRLAAVGRMALTNYLTHSLVYLFALTGAGLGLIGHIGATVCVTITIVVFALQIAFSNWWLRGYHFGPAEWLWRSLTYGRIQPMRRDELASASF